MKQVKIRVTVVDPDSHDGEHQVTFHGYADVEVTEECGLRKLHSAAGPMERVPNGQRRLCIKAWAGCPSYDAFVAEE